MTPGILPQYHGAQSGYYTVAVYPEGYVVCLNFELTYPQTERSTALGWFLSGTLIGPALGEYFPSTTNFITNTHRPIHRRYHRNVPKLARHLLAPNSSGRRSYRLLLLPAARNHPQKTCHRARRPPSDAESKEDVAMAESIPRHCAVPIPKPASHSEYSALNEISVGG